MSYSAPEFLSIARLKVTGTPARLQKFHNLTRDRLDRSGWGSGGAVFYNCLDASWRRVLTVARQTKVSVAAEDDLRGFVAVVAAGVACRIPITDAEL